MSKENLTTREKRFVEAMADPRVKSKTEAAIVAGYSPKSARTIGYQNATKRYISEAILERKERALAHHEVTKEEVLGHAVFNMRSSMDDLIDEEGYFDLTKARETGALDLAKEMEIIETFNLDTHEKQVRHKIKFESPAAARKEVANYIGLENFGESKPNSETEIARAIFRELLELGHKRENIIAKLEAEFPAIDVETLEVEK